MWLNLVTVNKTKWEMQTLFKCYIIFRPGMLQTETNVMQALDKL